MSQVECQAKASGTYFFIAGLLVSSQRNLFLWQVRLSQASGTYIHSRFGYPKSMELIFMLRLSHETTSQLTCHICGSSMT